MKTINKIILPITLLAMLAGCASQPGEGGEQQSGGTNTSENADLPSEGEYTVTVKVASSLVTLTADKAFAKKGETVTIKAQINDPDTKIARVLYGTQTCSKVDNSTYTFVMPNNPVTVTCELIMEGDVTLQGDIAAKFEKEGDVYVARNVEVNSDAIFDLVVVGNDGTTKKAESSDFDRFKTFANLGASYGTKRHLTIAGGATYDFFYDVNNGKLPCYVKRTKINDLPNGSSPKSLSKLFAGTIHSQTCVLPSDVVGLTYENKAAKDKLVWEAYEGNKTLAEVSKIEDNGSYTKDRYIYTETNNNSLKVVDTFVPGQNAAYDNNDKLHQDSVAFSGIYKINDVDQEGKETSLTDFNYENKFVSSNVANSLINNAPITMYDFEQDIRHSYRDGLKKGGDIVQSNLEITSEELNETAFKTNIVSSKTFDNTQDSHNGGTIIKKHYEYRCELIFTSAGALVSGHYVEKIFDEKDYNFDNQSFLNGDADTNFASKQEAENDISIEYIYDAKGTDIPVFNSDKYFISEISKVSVNNPACKGDQANKLNVGDLLNKYVDIKYAPSTALNAYQYSIIGSDNAAIIKKDTSGYVAVGMGTANITVGIVNKLGVSAKANVTVIDSRTVKGIYMNPRHGEFQDSYASSANIYTGQLNEFGLETKFSDNSTSGVHGIRFPSDFKATFVEQETYGFTAVVDHERQSLLIDGTNAQFVESEEPIKLHVKISTDHLDPDWADSIHPLEFIIYKGMGFDDILGKWVCTDQDCETDYVLLTKDPSNEEIRPYKGVVHTPDEDYHFNYSYNPLKHLFNVKLLGEKFDLSNIYVEYDATTNELGCIVEYVKWTSEELTITYMVGFIENHNKLFAKFSKEAK